MTPEQQHNRNVRMMPSLKKAGLPDAMAIWAEQPTDTDRGRYPNSAFAAMPSGEWLQVTFANVPQSNDRAAVVAFAGAWKGSVSKDAINARLLEFDTRESPLIRAVCVIFEEAIKPKRTAAEWKAVIREALAKDAGDG